MNNDRELLQQTLDALEEVEWTLKNMSAFKFYPKYYETTEALRARLAQPEPEPVAWMYEYGTDHGDAVNEVRWYKNVCLEKPTGLVRNIVPLYVFPPQREWQNTADKCELEPVPAKGTLLPAQPKPEPVAWKDAPSKIYLQVCEESNCDQPFDSHIEISWCQDKINDSDISYVRADIAPPQRECVSCAGLCCQDYEKCNLPCTPRGREQARREGQGLTDEEIEELYLGSFDEGQFARAIEAKLKEKNI